MAILIITVDIDIDPSLEDPQEVAETLISERLSDGGEWNSYADVTPESVEGSWQ